MANEINVSQWLNYSQRGRTTILWWHLGKSSGEKERDDLENLKDSVASMSLLLK